MVNITCNGRHLALTFRYNATYNIDIPDPFWNARQRDALKGLEKEERAQRKAAFARSNPRFMRVQRSLTIVELHEGRGKDSKLIAKLQRKLNYKDQDLFQLATRKSPKAEAFRRDMIRVLFQGATQSGILSKLERKCFWDAINTRFGKRPNPTKVSPPEGTPAAAKVGRPIEVVDAEATESTPDTIKPQLRLVVGRRIDRVGTPSTPASSGGHRVINKIVAYPAGDHQWHPLMSVQVMPWETRH